MSCLKSFRFLRGILLLALCYDSESTHAQKLIVKDYAHISEKEIRNEISIYPAHMLKMVESITLENLEKGVSGKAGFNWISLSSDYSIGTIRPTIHHELSSVFLQQPDIFKTFNIIGYQFIELNGNSISYYSSKGFVDLPVTSLTEDEKNYFAGNSYAKSNFENDYNMICEELFINGKNFIAFVESKPHTAIYKKVMIVIDYYHSLDSKFTIDFFRTR